MPFGIGNAVAGVGRGIAGGFNSIASAIQNNPEATQGFIGNMAGIGAALAEPGSPAARLGEMVQNQVAAGQTQTNLDEQLKNLLKAAGITGQSKAVSPIGQSLLMTGLLNPSAFNTAGANSSSGLGTLGGS